jgi:hypothetical protein
MNLIKLKQKAKDILFINSSLAKFISFSKLGNLSRFGNQLFQYAAIKSYSVKNNIPIILPPAEEHPLSELNINFLSQPISLIKFATDYNYSETKYNYDPIFYNYYKRIDVEGYFQSEKYFIDIKEEIHKDFIIRDKKINDISHQIISDLKNKYPGKSIVSVHVRRGDNVPSKISYGDKYIGAYSPNKNEKHPLMKIEYYRSAMNKFPDSVFLFFSDTEKDINWCENTFGKTNNNIYLHYSDLEDFFIMQLCDHNIISNSSFSWWAAWLNNNPQKRIISPKVENWFGPYYAHYNMNDLIPDSWEQI